jgi:hypothetical protein
MPTEGSAYNGQIKDGLFHGKGALNYQGRYSPLVLSVFLDLFHSFGVYFLNLLHSFRVYFWIFSTRYECNFSGNEKYEGDWVYGKREGVGRFFYADGAVYEGTIFSTRFECSFHIFPTRFECSFHLFSTRFECSFPGQWVDDRIHGQGVSIFASGNRYEGQWENGKING